MPLGETLTILATLANAVQVLRTTNRPTEPPVEPEPAIDTMALMGFEFAKTANEAAIRRHESALNRISGVAFVSAAAVLISAFLGALSSDSPEGGSPLFIASICAFISVSTSIIVLRHGFSVSPLTLEDFAALQGFEQWQAIQRFVDRARNVERGNQRRLTALELGMDVLLVLVALQVVLAAVWLIR